jgi:hypothetical protein
MPRSLVPGIDVTTNDKGGIDILLKPPMKLAVRQPFVLKLNVSAPSPVGWNGKVSFRGHDSDGNRRYGRKDVEKESLICDELGATEIVGGSSKT